MAKVKNENFVVIQGWMVAELGLSGAALLIYAVIYGFSQDGQWFRGSQRYLAAWAGISRRQVLNVLAALERKKLIEKRVELSPKKVRHCAYRATRELELASSAAAAADQPDNEITDKEIDDYLNEMNMVF